MKSKSEVVRRSCQTHCETTRPIRPTKDVDALKYAGQKKAKKEKDKNISILVGDVDAPQCVGQWGGRACYAAAAGAGLLCCSTVVCSAALPCSTGEPPPQLHTNPCSNRPTLTNPTQTFNTPSLIGGIRGRGPIWQSQSA